MYYEINETTARRAKEMNSYRDYKAGSATAEYRAMVDEAKKIADRQKSRVDSMYHEKIDRLFRIYCYKLAKNLNKSNEIDTRCPSILVSGGSNFPVRKKEKQNAAKDTNMKEYMEIKGILEKIEGTGTGGISADDENAIDKLKSKLEQLEKSQVAMKAANAYYRKNKTMKGYKTYTNDEASRIDEKIKMVILGNNALILPIF